MKKTLITGVIYGVALLVIPEVVMGTTSTDFGAADISSHADKISDFIFGPLGKTAAALGAGYGFCTSLVSGSAKPLITFGAIGLIGVAIPTFVKAINTVLLP